MTLESELENIFFILYVIFLAKSWYLFVVLKFVPLKTHLFI